MTLLGQVHALLCSDLSLLLKFDWVYMTGDLPAHNVWDQSKNDQVSVLGYISSLMKQYLPSKKVYFSLGNHEGVPVNR